MKEFYLDNGRIYYRTNDFAPGRLTLVFAHGVSGSSSAWLPYEKIFQGKYNILTYDIRGHGLSKKYPRYEDYAVKNFAFDLHELVAYLKIPKFILISNSFAAQVHLEYLNSWRDTVAANIFTSPEILLVDSFANKIIRPVLAVITFLVGLLPFSPAPKGRVDYGKYVGSTDWSPGRNIADMRNTGLRAHFYTLRHSFEPGNNYALEKINVPTIIIHGQDDTMVPIKNALEMSKKIKDCKFVSIPNVDHNTAHNAVSEMSQAIESFIERQNLLY